jgi:hypothetical protein
MIPPTFATPDFGAGAGAAACLGFIWLLVIVVTIFGLWRGSTIWAGTNPKARATGVAVMVATLMLPLSCCFGPSLFVRLTTGNFPVDRSSFRNLDHGMSADEVRETLGTPHSIREGHGGQGETWYYWTDAFGLGYFRVQFGSDGRLDGVSSN